MHKYYKIINKLDNLKNNLAPSFENSKLYQNEIINFNETLSNFITKYENINKDITNIKNECNTLNLKNTSTFLSNATSKIVDLKEIIKSIKESVEDGSKLTYETLLSNFNKTYEKVTNQSDSLKHNINNYNNSIHELRTIDVNNPEYNYILNEKNRYLKNINTLKNNINNHITELQELLDKGLSKN